jgi:hypothetical protein
MGWLQDLLKEVPLSPVLQERVKLAEDRYANASRENEELTRRIGVLEAENAELRRQIPRIDAATTISPPKLAVSWSNCFVRPTSKTATSA